jgi:hypothetical protein
VPTAANQKLSALLAIAASVASDDYPDNAYPNPPSCNNFPASDVDCERTKEAGADWPSLVAAAERRAEQACAQEAKALAQLEHMRGSNEGLNADLIAAETSCRMLRARMEKAARRPALGEITGGMPQQEFCAAPHRLQALSSLLGDLRSQITTLERRAKDAEQNNVDNKRHIVDMESVVAALGRENETLRAKLSELDDGGRSISCSLVYTESCDAQDECFREERRTRRNVPETCTGLARLRSPKSPASSQKHHQRSQSLAPETLELQQSSETYGVTVRDPGVRTSLSLRPRRRRIQVLASSPSPQVMQGR